METRVAVLAVIVQEGSSVQALNELLHQYGPYIIGRMGVPYRERGVNIISVALLWYVCIPGASAVVTNFSSQSFFRLLYNSVSFPLTNTRIISCGYSA